MATVIRDDVIKNVRDLPSLPAVVMELLNSIDEDNVDISVLANKVAQDMALTAKTLSLANSSYFAPAVKVTTIQQAITLLGMRNVRTLITKAALSGCFPERACKGFDHALFWQHSTATSIAAGILALHLNLNQDYARTAALLHDIGRLVLVSCFPQDYASAVELHTEQGIAMLEAERQVFGMDHAEAGALLAANWNFSDTMRLAIAGHHEPDRPGAGFLAAIVHVANAMVHQIASAEEGHQIMPSVSRTAWEALNLDDAIYARICQEVQVAFEKLQAAT
ncbi:HDOD domain-containing protein [Actimicrobium antarcticum]|uniref:HDOD domain-containing protein n=1 Tax=Actimicrobium antarcticum TaxID=1051899 RepID=A0ABP7TC58_9BURK